MSRPLFHFTARTGWINDPHGITARDGGYDVFYQYVPDRTTWAPQCQWGHARGADLLSLSEREPALVPGDGDDGIWTGSLVDGDEGPRIFYTSVSLGDLAIGRVRVATPLDSSWDGWRKGEVVVEAPPVTDLVGFRDPFLRRDPDAWRMFLGAGDGAGTALAFGYVSSDLEHWTYEGVVLSRSTAEREPAWLGALWECPQIFDLGDRSVMLSSAWERDLLHHAGYAIGDYAAGRFTAETWGRLTYGPSYYAPSFYRDADGRACMTLWMRGVEDLSAGWAGAHSIPYLLTFEGDVLRASPHPDLERYREPAVESGIVPRAAADIVWGGTGRLEVADAGGRRLFDVEPSGHGVTLTVGDDRWGLPCGDAPIRIVVDAGALELASDQGLLGVPLPAAAVGLRVSGTDTTVYPLTRADAPPRWSSSPRLPPPLVE